MATISLTPLRASRVQLLAAIAHLGKDEQFERLMQFNRENADLLARDRQKYTTTHNLKCFQKKMEGPDDSADLALAVEVELLAREIRAGWTDSQFAERSRGASLAPIEARMIPVRELTV